MFEICDGRVEEVISPCTRRGLSVGRYSSTELLGPSGLRPLVGGLDRSLVIIGL